MWDTAAASEHNAEPASASERHLAAERAAATERSEQSAIGNTVAAYVCITGTATEPPAQLHSMQPQLHYPRRLRLLVPQNRRYFYCSRFCYGEYIRFPLGPLAPPKTKASPMRARCGLTYDRMQVGSSC